MEHLLLPLRKDLECLYENNFVENALNLNKSLGSSFLTNVIPMYFTGQFDAKTVFVMLNPGDGNAVESFLTVHKGKFKNLEEFIIEEINSKICYGRIDRKRLDSFDLKQAAFLSNFEESGIYIPEHFWEKDICTKYTAKENVLMQKLQLELIPYASNTFNLFKNLNEAIKHIEKFENHIFRIFDSIFEYERKFVIFGSKQFYNIFKTLSEKYQDIVSIDFGNLNIEKIPNLSKRVSFRNIKIRYFNKSVNALIANSFPRRDLPNAYPQMSLYGRLCFQNYGNI
ncbi:MAG: hypothetical protein JNL36_02005 [Candidatus Kapabacteria bacterium]|nr:hypothetical protein [Candidatus Kapabacteria bacterium]